MDKSGEEKTNPDVTRDAAGGDSPPSVSVAEGFEEINPQELSAQSSELPTPNRQAIEAYSENETHEENVETANKTTKKKLFQRKTKTPIAGNESEIAEKEKLPKDAKLSKKGEVFNPHLHSVNKDGQPIETKLGYWRKRPKRRTAKLDESVVVQQEQERLRLDRLNAAVGSASLTLISVKLVTAIDATKPERKLLIDEFDRMFEMMGVAPKVPAWLGPAFVTANIIAAHIEEEKPKTRIQKLKEKMLLVWHRLKTKRKGRIAEMENNEKNENESQPHNRNVGGSKN